MSLAFPGPSEDLEASSFDEAEESLFKNHITPWQFLVNSFSVGRKTPNWKQILY